ncbi:MAG: UDP-N-acetylmuramoyl-tripeptide--D-alanyl-D-alanine ligase [Lentisphaeria bacterium]|nr:UDP-N-acetylmuramoyl-tripeptide--D-alanyl-D-alanine ligase [Candidatus Neomarinimicrobiota bacterium]MCF7842880.1 UDP-N-acetylmuramoyl-tripeptide--D-alanyl-D-alanine ligase [Lentisphaeria bacterium]
MAVNPQDCRALTGARISGEFRTPIEGAVIDSRNVRPGNLFAALPGEQTDGHKFIPQAVKNGAAAILAHQDWTEGEIWSYAVPRITVPDVERALGELAHRHRQRFDIPVLAITGTNGKTTTKNMVAAVLETRYTLLKTPGNLNNQLGLPITLLSLNQNHTAAVLEMGASREGDIAYLCEIAEPTEGMITNIGRAHLEYFHSLETVQQVKGELFAFLQDRGRIFANADDARVMALTENARQVVPFSRQWAGELKLEDLGPDEWGCHAIRVNNQVTIKLHVSGTAMISNAAAAIAVGRAHGIPLEPIATALAGYISEPGRMQRLNLHGFTVIHDAYNANPESTRNSLNALAQMPVTGRRIVVFADMLELGESSKAEHAKVAQTMMDTGMDAAFLLGPECLEIQAVLAPADVVRTNHYDDLDALGKALIEFIQPGDMVLLKGSRGMGLEKLLPMLEGVTVNAL